MKIRRGRLVVLVGTVAGGVLTWLVIGGVDGAVAAVPAAVICGWLSTRIGPASVRREHRQAARDLPLACDLLAASLRAGAPLERALGIVALAVGGPLGRQLRRVCDGLRLGLEPREAWSALRLPEAARVVEATVRGVDSGAALARALSRVADDLRDSRHAAVEASASRVGVLIVLPLGLCFLPAFVFAGIAPVIVAVLGDALR